MSVVDIDTLAARIDGLAKPRGALGRLERLAVDLARMQERATPRATQVTLLLFAGDHGLVKDGVSAYPAAVTRAMVETLLAGRASANALARSVGAEVRVIDAGVDADFGDRPGLHGPKVRRGTRNAAVEPAMTRDEVDAALALGAAHARRAIVDGADVLAIGEMGIGNTAASSLLLHRLAGIPLAQCVGPGAGHDAAGLTRKQAVLARAAARTAADDPRRVLEEFGGLEIAAMAGAIHEAAATRTPVLVDGFIASAAALAAVRLRPASRGHCLFAHMSAEPGHRALLAALDAEPLLQLDLRLGEGTGALLAVPLLRAATTLLDGSIATLDEVLAAARA